MRFKIDRQNFLKKAELYFTLFALLHYWTGWMKLIITGGASEGDGVDLLAFNYQPVELIFLLTYLVFFVLLVVRWRKVSYAAVKEPIIWIIVLVALASTFWSVAPSDTLRRTCTGLFGTTFFGIYLGTRYTLKEQLKIFGYFGFIVLIWSILFSVLLPRYGVEQAAHAGAWRGIFGHKNHFGAVMSFITIIFVMYRSLMPSDKKWIGSGAVALSLVLVVLSKSTTALINTAVLIFALFLYQTIRLRYILLVPAFISIVTFGGVVTHIYLTYTEELFALIGKDPSLTGRADIWEFVWDMIEKRPFLGYGFTAFWNGLDGPSAYVIRAARWDVPSAHNGLLELWSQLGLLGVSIYALGFVMCLLLSIRWARISNGIDGLWPLIGLTYIVMGNLTEGSLIAPKDPFWILYVMFIISLKIPQSIPKSTPSYDLNHSTSELKTRPANFAETS